MLSLLTVLGLTSRAPAPLYDCNHNGIEDAIDISSHASQDCNINGAPDECDITLHYSVDANGNGVPDECATDCNANGLSDYVEIKPHGAGAWQTWPSDDDTPYDPIVGDVDGDGDLDVLVSNIDPATVTFYLNDGTAHLTVGRTLSTASSPAGIVLADFDNDGDLDLAVVSFANRIVTIYDHVSPQSLEFQPVASYVTGQGPDDIAAGDLNGDGLTDLVIGNYYDTTFTVLLNSGGLGFQTTPPAPTESAPSHIELADFDANGTLDIVATHDSDYVTITRNRGDGTFKASIAHPVDGLPLRMAVGDLDGDGDIDVAVPMQLRNSLWIMKNDGRGNLTPSSFLSQPNGYPFNISPRTATAVDFDLDGDLDIACANGILPTLLVFWNRGNAKFDLLNQFDGPIAQGIQETRAGDFNGDGKPDIVASNYYFNYVAVFSNSSLMAGKLDRDVNGVPDECQLSGNDCNSNGMADTVEIALDASLDCDTNGILDICELGGGDCNANQILDTCEVAVPLDVTVHYAIEGKAADKAAAADFNGDGLVDFIIANGQLQSRFVVCLNSPAGLTIGPETPFPLASASLWALKATDIDSDGDIDVLAVFASSAIKRTEVMLNDGHGIFSWGTPFPMPTFTPTLEAVDIDRDGDNDLIFNQPSGAFVYVILNAGNGTFGPAISFAAPVISASVVCGDIDNDGFPDVVGARIFHNLGVDSQGQWLGLAALPQPIPVGLSGWLALADLNCDGLLDIANTRFNQGTIRIMLNAGESVFEQPIEIATCRYPSQIASCDFDNDGLVDLCTVEGWVDPDSAGTNLGNICLGSHVTVHHNRGQLNFDRTDYATAARPTNLLIGDDNADGLLDLFVSGWQTGEFLALRNHTQTGTSIDCNYNSVPDSCDIQSSQSADLNGNGTPDECDNRTQFGDMNCDHVIDGRDILGFAHAMVSLSGFGTMHPACSWLNADFNHDGAVDGIDLNNFLSILLD